MIARVAIFEGVNVAEFERTLGEAESVIRPMVENLSGYQGSLELMAPSGKGLSITFFDTDEHAQAAEPTFDQEMPQKLGHIFETWEGRRVSVDRYNVAADSRG
jgi:hypothetical protein